MSGERISDYINTIRAQFATREARELTEAEKMQKALQEMGFGHIDMTPEPPQPPIESFEERCARTLEEWKEHPPQFDRSNEGPITDLEDLIRGESHQNISQDHSYGAFTFPAVSLLHWGILYQPA